MVFKSQLKWTPPPPVKHDEQIKKEHEKGPYFKSLYTHVENTCLGCVLHPKISAPAISSLRPEHRHLKRWVPRWWPQVPDDGDNLL